MFQSIQQVNEKFKIQVFGCHFTKNFLKNFSIRADKQCYKNSPIQDYVHADEQTQPTFEMTPGFKPFTITGYHLDMNFGLPRTNPASGQGGK